jgi:murein DD-endopeptidase MepM/ murein hydrolase activator NlpD
MVFHRNKKNILLTSIIILTIGIFAFSILPKSTSADTSEIKELNDQIENKRSELEKLDAEIARQRALVQNASGRATNLQSKINQLEATRGALLTDISETETQIEKAELTLSKLDIEIRNNNYLIDKNSDALAESIRKINVLKSTSMVEKILGYADISDFWNDFEQTEKIQKRLSYEVDTLQDLHEDLRTKQLSKLEEKSELSQYKVELSSEREAVESTKEEQAQLLSRTKSEEAAYQKLLQETLRKKQAFEKELLEIESKLNLLIDPESYPEARRGILDWPVSNVIITQQFGGTAFARTNPGVYSRPFHPGTDFGVPTGTAVKSVYDGKVIGFGNTDAYPGCNAWGKWIMVEHVNGLSSLYAHLSSISVSNGQTVSKGQTIGLSGNTGVSTGPHLHLSLYASQGVQIGRYSQYKAGTGCSATAATGPFADLDAYLDPMNYLPSL